MRDGKVGVRSAIRLLHLEDSADDAELVRHRLTAGGVATEITVVSDHAGFESALQRQEFDLILSDYNLPGYTGPAALKYTRQVSPDVPVIMISGTVGEEEAVACLQMGATDYLLKDHLERLVPAVKRALDEAAARRQRHSTERALFERERALSENEERTNFALAAAGMGVWEVEFATNRMAWSDTMAPVFGLTPDKAPRTTEEYYRLIDPDDRAEVKDSLERAISGEQNYATEFRTTWPDGTTHWIHGRAQVSYDRDGQPTRLLGIALDITDRKLLERRIEQAQKMDAIGQLAGGIAHDFNNLVTIINGTAELALEQLPDGSQIQHDLEDIRRAGERAAALTRQLLAFSRKQLLQPRIIDLRIVVAEIEGMIRRLIGEDIDLVVVPAADLGNVKADPGQMEQVLVNLAVNARDAMPKGGQLTIELQNVDIDEDYAKTHDVAAEAGSYVMFAVSDTGVGIDEATRKRMFEPFFTTKGPGAGTGLGLSTVYGIVQQSNGVIWAYSEMGRGTTFKIYLPRVVAEVSAQRRMPSIARQRGTETVLLVEDLGGLRELTQRMLEASGYVVLATAHASEALEVMRTYGKPVHLVLTDVVMPGIDGRKLVEKLHEVNPEMKALYMSGYTDDVIVRHGVLERGMAFLSKPFTASELIRKVREVIDSEG